jgi:hypothetical protein
VRRLLFSLIAVAFGTTVPAGQPPTEKQDLGRLQGALACIGGNLAGKSFSEDKAAQKQISFLVKGDRLQEFENGMHRSTRSIKLKVPQNLPREIDTVNLDRPS